MTASDGNVTAETRTSDGSDGSDGNFETQIEFEIQSELQVVKADLKVAECENLPSLSPLMSEVHQGQGFQPSREPSSTRHQSVTTHHDPSPSVTVPSGKETTQTQQPIQVGDLVILDSPGSKRHGKQGTVIQLKTERFQGQELLLADLSFPGERRPVEAQLSWLRRVGEEQTNE